MKLDVKELISKILNEFANVTTFTLDNNSSVSGSLKVRVVGRIATISGTLNYPYAGIGLQLADFPIGNSKYYPFEQIWLSCDFYTTGAGAEAWLTNGGTVAVNQPVGGVDLKISGTWIISG